MSVPIYSRYSERFIDSLKISRLASKLSSTDVKKVRFTGGEPFLHRCLTAMIHAFSMIDVYTSVVTNATLLNNNKFAKLKNAGLDAIWCSLHSVNSSGCDDHFDDKGFHESISSLLVNAKKHDLELNINYPVGKNNYKEVPIVLEWLRKHSINQINILKLTPLGKASISQGFDHFTMNEWQSLWREFKNEDLFSIKIQKVPPPCYSS